MNLTEMFGSAIIAVLISGLFGVIGILVVYQFFPILSGLEVPITLSIQTQNDYDRLRQTASILGWFFGLIPFIGWKIYVDKNLNKETTQQFHDNVEVKS